MSKSSLYDLQASVSFPVRQTVDLDYTACEKNSLETVGFMMAATYLCQWIFVVAASET